MWNVMIDSWALLMTGWPGAQAEYCGLCVWLFVDSVFRWFTSGQDGGCNIRDFWALFSTMRKKWRHVIHLYLCQGHQLELKLFLFHLGIDNINNNDNNNKEKFDIAPIITATINILFYCSVYFNAEVRLEWFPGVCNRELFMSPGTSSNVLKNARSIDCCFQLSPFHWLFNTPTHVHTRCTFLNLLIRILLL